MSSITPAQQQPQTVVVVNQVAPKKMRHGLHLFLSIITGGLWLPVWLILAISNR